MEIPGDWLQCLGSSIQDRFQVHPSQTTESGSEVVLEFTIYSITIKILITKIDNTHATYSLSFDEMDQGINRIQFDFVAIRRIVGDINYYIEEHMQRETRHGNLRQLLNRLFELLLDPPRDDETQRLLRELISPLAAKIDQSPRVDTPHERLRQLLNRLLGLLLDPPLDEKTKQLLHELKKPLAGRTDDQKNN